MKRFSSLAAVFAVAALGLVGCDDGRADLDNSDPAATPPPSAVMKERMHEGAIKDGPSDPSGVPATGPTSPAGEALRNSLKEGPGSIKDAADPTENDAADPDAPGEDAGPGGKDGPADQNLPNGG